MATGVLVPGLWGMVSTSSPSFGGDGTPSKLDNNGNNQSGRFFKLPVANRSTVEVFFTLSLVWQNEAKQIIAR